MSITAFVPEIWTANLLTALRKTLVYAGPQVVNRDYEGEISRAGDTVRITSIGDPTIVDYNQGDTLNYEDLQDAGQALLIDQQKAFAFKVDDIDRAQAAGTVMPEAMSRAAYRLADTADQFIASLYTAVQSANQVAAGAAVTTTTASDDFYNKVLVPLKVKLDEADVPTVGRYVVVPSWGHGLLLQSKLFVDASQSADPTTLRNGYVGRAAGFDVLMSNNVPNPSGSDYVVTAGTNSAISYADQIVDTEPLRLQSSFSDAVRGLHVYGAKVVRPDSIASALVTRPAGI